MPFITYRQDPKTKWIRYTLMLDPDMNAQIDEFSKSVARSGDAPIGRASAVRLLLAAGLESIWGQDTMVTATMQGNAKAAAMARLAGLMEELIELFKDPDINLEPSHNTRKSRKGEQDATEADQS